MPIHKRTFGAIKAGFAGGPGAALGSFFGLQPGEMTRATCAARGGDWRSATKSCVMDARVQMPSFLSPIDRLKAAPVPHRNGHQFPVGQVQVERPGILGATQRFLPGGFSGYVDSPMGQATMGQYGAALVPDSVPSIRRDCTFGGTIRGMILGSDGLCYNKGQISNKERFWPRGRRPLLSGGEMRAISIAARAASRVQRTTAKLESIGMLKKKSSGGYLPRKNG